MTDDASSEQARPKSNIEDLSPVYGILSMHGRKQAVAWSCLVCGASQPSTEEVCSICNRDRIPSWLLDAHGRAVIPGSILRCPRGSARYTARPIPPPIELSGDPSPRSRRRSPSPPPSPSGLSRSLSPRVARAGASSPTTAPASPGQNAGILGGTRPPTKHLSSPPLSGRPDRRNVVPADTLSPRRKRGATTGSSHPKAPTSRNGNRAGNNSGSTPYGGSNSRRKVGRAEEDFDAATVAAKAKFEAQPGDSFVFVVAVNGVRPQPPRASRSVEGYCVVEGGDGQAKSRALVKVVIDMAKESSVEVVDPSLDSEERKKFLQFGLCGRCDRVFRICQVWEHVLHNKSRYEFVVEGETKLRQLSELVARKEHRKEDLRAARGARHDVLETSESLKAIHEEVAAIGRALEPLVMLCPFCLWSWAPLFVAASGRLQGEKLNSGGLAQGQ